MHRIFTAVTITLFSGVLAVSIGAAQPVAQQTITFIDVGQGDAALVQDGNGYNVLIDGGDTGAGKTVLAFLRARGATHLDVVLATHPHEDHIGGLIALLQAPDIVVDAILTNGCTEDTITWTNFLNAASARDLLLIPVQFPQVLTWGAMDAHVLSPSAGIACGDPNADSVVIRLDYDQMNTFFAGDIDAAVEATVVARGTPVAAEVLKVAHHGSKYGTSMAFLDASRPDLAVISVGLNNEHSHPAPETLTRLVSSGAVVERTDQLGNIVVTSDGETFDVFPPIEPFDHFVFLPVVSVSAK